MITTKLYYEDMFLSECEAVIADVSEKGVVCDKTVAYPEGGGQEGDKGTLIIEDSENEQITIPFIDTQKGFGRVLNLEDFPTIQVDTQVYHVIESEYLKHFEVGMKIRIKIDVERRAKITVSHTGIHLVLMGIENLRPSMSKFVRGCHITTDYARLDFFTEQRFSKPEIEDIARFVNEIVDRNEPIHIFPHSEEPEAWYWKCLDTIYPCGGTHLHSTRYVGHVILKRKNMGKNLERIIAKYLNAHIPRDLYHEFRIG